MGSGGVWMLDDQLTKEVEILDREAASTPHSAVIRCHDTDAPGWEEMVLGEVAASIVCDLAAALSRAGSG